MPILRLTKNDPQVAVTHDEDMTLEFVSFDKRAYLFNWTGRGALVPLADVARAVNPETRAGMFRSIWIAPDAINSGFWDVGDTAVILSSRLGARGAPVAVTQAVVRLPISGPYDRIAFRIGAKAAGALYSIDILINSTDEGESRFPELPTPT